MYQQYLTKIQENIIFNKKTDDLIGVDLSTKSYKKHISFSKLITINSDQFDIDEYEYTKTLRKLCRKLFKQGKQNISYV